MIVVFSSKAPGSVKGWSSVTHHVLSISVSCLKLLSFKICWLYCVAFAQQSHSALYAAPLNQVWAVSPRWHQALFQELFFLCAWEFSFWMCAIRGIIENRDCTVAKSNWHCSFFLRDSFYGRWGHSAAREMTHRPSCLLPWKPILVRQMWWIRKKIYSDASNLRRWWTPVLKNYFNISDTSARLYRGIMGKRELWNFWQYVVLAQAYSFCSNVTFQCVSTGHLWFYCQHQHSSFLKYTVQL